jgi:hypothetical protein
VPWHRFLLCLENLVGFFGALSSSQTLRKIVVYERTAPVTRPVHGVAKNYFKNSLRQFLFFAAQKWAGRFSSYWGIPSHPLKCPNMVFFSGAGENTPVMFCAPQNAAFDPENFLSARTLIPVKAQCGGDFIFRGNRNG